MAAGPEFVLVMEAMGEPFAETGGSNRRTVVVAWAVGDYGPGVAEGGGERGCEFQGVVEELFGAGFGFVQRSGPRLECRRRVEGL